MKTWWWTGLVVLLMAVTGWGEEAATPPPDPLKDLAARISRLEDAAAQSKAGGTKEIEVLVRRIETLEKRLGDTYATPTTFNSVERRLTDLERKLDKAERLLLDLQNQLRRAGR